MIIRIKQFIQNRKNFCFFIKRYHKLLKPGCYQISQNCTHLVNADSVFKAKEFLETDFKKIKLFFSESGNFSELLICDHGNSAKFFDYENKVVQTIYKKPKNIIVEDKNILMFPRPRVLEQTSEYKKEVLIQDNKENKFLHLLKFYQEFYKGHSVDFDCLIHKNDSVVFSCFKKLDCIKMPRCIQHGDCWSANIFVTNDGLFFIDFDFTKEYFFLYDVMLYVFTEAFIKNDIALMQQLISGKYNKEIKIIIQNANVDLSSFSIKDLFLYAIDEMIIERFEKKNNKKMPKIIINFLMNNGVIVQ